MMRTNDQKLGLIEKDKQFYVDLYNSYGIFLYELILGGIGCRFHAELADHDLGSGGFSGCKNSRQILVEEV